MIDFESINCCGCSACVSACPWDCLSMVPDKEGFLFPQVTAADQCIECGKCASVCPVLNRKQERKVEQQAFIVQNTDEKTRLQSTSGGAFSAIAEEALRRGGVVYGAAYDPAFQVVHLEAESADDLWKFRNSKYVQSNMDGVFDRVLDRLKSGRFVCFSGTPCQVEGLLAFLGKSYDRLITVDVVCHAIGSPLIWQKYLELTSGTDKDQICFRWKHYGYKYSTMSFFQGGKEVYFSGVESDPMLRAYFTNNCARNSCYDCPFKKRYRASDITIWDCYHPEFFDKTFSDDKGTSSVLIHSEKGKLFFDAVLKSGALRFLELVPDRLVENCREMTGSVQRGAIRDTLLRDASVLSGAELFEKYFPVNAITKTKRLMRLILLKLGIYSMIQRFLYKRRAGKGSSAKGNM